MTRNYLFMLISISLGAAEEFTSVAQEDGHGTKKLGTTAQISTNKFAQMATEETLPNPDRSLDSKIMIINNFLIAGNGKLDEIKPPYIQQETYGRLKSQYVEIYRAFGDARSDYEILRIQDGYLFPLSEPDKTAIHKVRVMSASVSKKLQLVTTAMTAFQANLDRAMEKAEQK